MEGWAQARILGLHPGDTLGYDLAAVDPDGDGQDALAVGVPHFPVPPPYGYLASADPPSWPRVHLLSDLQGTLSPGDTSVIAHEQNVTDSIGQSVEALTETGPVLVGDYWGSSNPGHVMVLDASVDPIDLGRAWGEDGELCGADVGVADVDASGTPDLVTACLRSPLKEPGRLRVYGENPFGSWNGLAWLEGTTPYGWFGRPTTGGFDLDGDGLSELAIGEQHIGEDLESAVHLVSGPWRGHCTLADLEARILWNDFVAAMLTTGDLDGDGGKELLITDQGMPYWGANPAPTPGWVRVVRDPVPEDGPVEQFSWLVFEGLLPEEGFGADAAVGDFNADGCADVAVGAPGFDLNADNPPGKVYVFHGPFEPGTISAADAEVVLWGSSDWDWFGYKLVVGEFDGDSGDDLAVSAIGDSSVAERAGSVYVLPGGPAAGKQ